MIITIIIIIIIMTIIITTIIIIYLKSLVIDFQYIIANLNVFKTYKKLHFIQINFFCRSSWSDI